MPHTMYKQLIINMTAHETQVALLEDGTIAELFIDWEKNSEITGNVYKGRVQRVLPGMQVAFVDIGLKQAAFIHVNDVLGDNLGDVTTLFHDNGEEDTGLTDLTVSEAEQITIEELLTDGQEILVQVAKSPIGTKGARVTSYISLPGRFLVMMPNANHIGVSRRIEDDVERQRLRDLVESLRSEPVGYIVRTAAEGTSEEKIASEMSFFRNLWENIQRKYPTAPSPSLLHQELNVVHRAVRDLMTHEAEKIVIDSKEGYDSVLAFSTDLCPA